MKRVYFWLLGLLCIFILTVMFVDFYSKEPEQVYSETNKASETLRKSILEGLKDYKEVTDVLPNITETMATFTIFTTLKETDEGSESKAEEIKNKVDDIVSSKNIEVAYANYFITVTNIEGENLLARSLDTSFDKQIKDFGKKLTNQVPENYSKKNAIENGDILPGFITETQRRRINEFISNVNNNKSDFIRFVRFPSPNSPIITEFQFNGELIYYREDSTRVNRDNRIDQDEEVIQVQEEKVKEDYCKKLVKDSIMSYITDCYKNDVIEF
ncbi:DUF4362 domain-containing protein [Metabacillus litoralis]|uniref:DUF4362 domain-containing protein n=1 Tax=Metabacillus TaxID=2675233 RepID=UPI001B949D3A|nr:DUF4362 domain-containing protein [Metabacillus litoralis]MCM3164543.1 DUF4362 domain-containing protein [Metabacillus litoralis]